MSDSDIRIGFAAEGTGNVGGALDFVRDKLKEHRLEMRQQMGMARMLGREMGELGLSAAGTGGEVSRLVAAFAVGSPFAVAGAAVGALVAHFREAGSAADEMLKQLKKGAADAIVELQKLQDKLAGITGNQRTLLDLQAKRALMQLAADSAVEHENSVIGGIVVGLKTVVGLDKTRSDTLKEEVARLDAQISATKEIVKVEGEIEAKRSKKGAAPGTPTFGPGDEGTIQKFYDVKRKMDEKEAAEEKAIADKLWNDIYQIEMKGFEREEKEKEAYLKKLVAAEKKAMNDLIQDAKRFTDSVVAGLDKMIFQGGTFKELMLGAFNSLKAIALSALSEILAKQLASLIAGTTASKVANLSETQGEIAVAVAGAAASQAAIPIIGPALAAAAAAEMLASLQAMTAPLLAFETGTPYVPYTGLALVHQGERIIPAAENAAGGGGTVNLYAMDAQSIKRAYRRSRGSFAQTLIDLARDRRTR